MESYKSIIKSTSVIAFVQIFKIFFVFVQNKVLAIVVGTAGYGVYGLFYTFSTLVSSFSTLGIDQAGVRQVAKNSGTKNFGKILWTFKTLLFISSAIAFAIICIFRNKISFSLFGTTDFSIGVVIVGLAIFFNGISQGYISILNGIQKLKYIALSQIFGVASSAIFAVIFIMLFKIKGIPYFILLASIVVFLFSIYYVYKSNLPRQKPDIIFFKKETKTLLSIGAGLAYSAIIVSISSYLSQIYIRKYFGLEWVGMYNAGNILSNVYLGIILTAMGVDLMPRLAKVVDSDEETNKLVNYQIEFGVLLSTVGIIGVIAFAPQFLTLIYSSKFTPATGIIKWQIMAAALKILSYPLGYILVVRKKTIQYMIVQTSLWGGSYVLLVVLTKIFGVKALGADFFIAFIFYIILMLFYNRKVFKPSPLCKKNLIVSWIFILAVLFINTIINIPIVMRYILNVFIISLNLYWTNKYLKEYMKIDVISTIRKRINLK
ncbi:oligosaccharide flippase family protein [Cloacibacterium normanense]|uniref:oligosaccharide flippase family protein n=1 Tax=Cloacibacterium normanense TaxID=237258 RepID=UPI0039194D5F